VNVWLPSIAAGMALAWLSATALIEDKRQWWQLCRWLALGSTLLSGLFVHLAASDFTSNVLGRDVAATLVLGATLPLAYGAICRLTHRVFATRGLNAVVGVAAVLGGTALSVFVVLWTHCTSGDCL
jgi:hypothetical protein